MTIERNRYFAGQLLDETDLTEEQLYFREKNRRHNRLLHGWGIVSGLGVLRGLADGEVYGRARAMPSMAMATRSSSRRP